MKCRLKMAKHQPFSLPDKNLGLLKYNVLLSTHEQGSIKAWNTEKKGWSLYRLFEVSSPNLLCFIWALEASKYKKTLYFPLPYFVVLWFFRQFLSKEVQYFVFLAGIFLPDLDNSVRLHYYFFFLIFLISHNVNNDVLRLSWFLENLLTRLRWVKVKSKVSYQTYSRVSNWVEILHEDCNIVYEGE